MTYLFKELEAKITTLQLTHSCRPQPNLIDSILLEILQIKARLKETFFQSWDDQTFEKLILKKDDLRANQDAEKIAWGKEHTD